MLPVPIDAASAVMNAWNGLSTPRDPDCFGMIVRSGLGEAANLHEAAPQRQEHPDDHQQDDERAGHLADGGPRFHGPQTASLSQVMARVRKDIGDRSARIRSRIQNSEQDVTRAPARSAYCLHVASARQLPATAAGSAVHTSSTMPTMTELTGRWPSP